MQILIQFITNDIVLISQAVLSLVLLVVLVWSVRRSGRRERQLAGEVAQLQRQMSELYDKTDRLQGDLNRHRELLRKIGDHVQEATVLMPEDFEVVRHSAGLIDSGELYIDLDSISVNGADFTLDNDIEAERIEPELILPVSSFVSDVSPESALNGSEYDVANDETDPLTRALQRSKTGGA